MLLLSILGGEGSESGTEAAQREGEVMQVMSWKRGNEVKATSIPSCLLKKDHLESVFSGVRLRFSQRFSPSEQR